MSKADKKKGKTSEATSLDSSTENEHRAEKTEESASKGSDMPKISKEDVGGGTSGGPLH